ncbi:putative OB-fold protein [Crossiella equi]|uniref:OB-fold protein n=1 Tax=Crossiella equi TaxID=130796 RepID=A0ABS5A929_9PSEU|nr:OB-fold nucleic acid binding domain-containing protein [Crossiella equi]MBP2473070.1 putative OB-fold protein [Crossiella equi]
MSHEPLSAELRVGFDYTRSLGPVLGAFITALGEHRVLGVRGPDGRVHVPPAEYDPVTAAPLTELVEVGTAGEVLSWTWQPAPLAGQPLAHPFAWALIRLDGADTALVHAVDAPAETMAVGLRVRARWAADKRGAITDLACFEPEDSPSTPPEPLVAAEPVRNTTSPVHLRYRHSASCSESDFLRALAEGRILGQRCPACDQVYVPARGVCPTDGVALTDRVEVAHTGTVTSFCVVNVPFLGQRIPPPYVAAAVLLDGADIPFQHLVLGIAPEEVRMGLRVRAVWKPRGDWGHTLENIEHFEPSGEPDAPFDSFARHL